MMSLRVHICKNEANADALIDFLKSDADFAGANVRKLEVPEIMVRDHSKNPADPKLINFNKVCVVYEE
jgi:hypothetical protein